MKKLLPTFIILLILGAGAAAVYLFQKQARARGSAETVEQYLPGDTEVLFSIPDLSATLSDWKTTDLYKIWSEPEVQDFLAKPLSKLPAHQDWDDTLAKVVRLSPSNIFVAVTSVDEKTNQPHFIAGFDFQGDKSDVDELLTEPKNEVHKRSPAGKSDLTNYKGNAVETFDAGDGNRLASVFLDHRYLLSNDLALLEATIDGCNQHTTADNALAKNAEFQAVLAKLPDEHETLIFLRPHSIIQRIFDLSASMGQPVDDARRAGLEKVKALGATTKIEGGKLRDSLYILAPGMDQKLAKLQMSSLPLTSPDTLIYAAGMLELPAQLELPDGPLAAGTPASGLLKGLRELAVMLRDHGLTLERFRAAFGNEFSTYLDWPSDKGQPTLVLSADVRDQALAGKFMDDLTNTLAAEGAWEATQANGMQFYSMSAANLSIVVPTLTLTGKHLIFGTNLPAVRDAAQREQSAGPNFTASESYKTASAAVATPNTAFFYLDSSALFDRVYGMFRGVALFGAALVYPQLGEYVDLSKLPNVQVISKHLSPTVFSQKIDEQGGLIESVGTVTLGQAAFAFLGGTAAAAVPLAQSQLGLGPKNSNAVPLPTPAAAGSPSPGPDSSPTQSGGNQ